MFLKQAKDNKSGHQHVYILAPRDINPFFLYFAILKLSALQV